MPRMTRMRRRVSRSTSIVPHLFFEGNEVMQSHWHIENRDLPASSINIDGRVFRAHQAGGGGHSRDSRRHVRANLGDDDWSAELIAQAAMCQIADALFDDP